MNKQRRSLRESKEPAPKSLPAAASSTAGEPVQEQIAALAYAHWEAEGRPVGRSEEHWLKAEAQIRQGRGA